MKSLGEQGFTMLEVLITVTCLGILAAFAIPRFANATILANTAKVQSDLQTLDSAIALYEVEKGTEPEKIGDLGDYVTDVANLRPPKGKCVMKDGSYLAIDDTSYSILAVGGNDSTIPFRQRAVCEGHTAGDFGR